MIEVKRELIEESTPDEAEEWRIKALAEFLEVDPEDIEEGYTFYGDFMTYETPDGEFLILTDEEADEACKVYCKETAWAFRPGFIIDHSKLPRDAEEMLKSFQENKCEGANETILALIDDFDEFVEDAISADGRGHFLSSYDGEEQETQITVVEENGDKEKMWLFIYRVN